MAFFTARERAALGKSVEIKVQGKVRELVRQEFSPRRRPPAEPSFTDDGGAVPRRRPPQPDFTDDAAAMVRRATDSSLQEIDDLIAVLQRRREKLISETARVQREVIEYAKLSQSTMQSTKIIAESLEHLNKVCHPRETEPEVASAEPGEATALGESSEAAVPVDDGGGADITAVPGDAGTPTTA
jgi:hypothetical protein